MSERFAELFGIAHQPQAAAGERQELTPPPWFGPPQDELGFVVAENRVLARSPTAVVALRHTTVFSTGLQFDFLAAARGLRGSQIQSVFHHQHWIDPEEALPDAFLRLGLELEDGRRISNASDPRRAQHAEVEPSTPVLVQCGGGGGAGGRDRVTMHPAYWLWPRPTSGALRLFVEWPLAGIELTAVPMQIDVSSATDVPHLWAD